MAKKRITESIEALPKVLQLDSERAKSHLLRHVTGLRMHPTSEAGKKFYVAEGELSIKRKRSPELCSTVTFGWLRGRAMLRVCHSEYGFSGVPLCLVRSIWRDSSKVRSPSTTWAWAILTSIFCLDFFEFVLGLVPPNYNFALLEVRNLYGVHV